MGWHCSHFYKISKISSPQMEREYMSQQIRLCSFCASCSIQTWCCPSILPLHDLPCIWPLQSWLYRDLQIPWYSVAFAYEMKEKLVVFCILHTCAKSRGNLTMNAYDSSWIVSRWQVFIFSYHPQHINLFSKLAYLLKSKALINFTILFATGIVNISYHAPINLPTEINSI